MFFVAEPMVFDKFKECINYIPIKEDFSDLIEIFQWCDKNPIKCKQIIYMHVYF